MEFILVSSCPLALRPLPPSLCPRPPPSDFRFGPTLRPPLTRTKPVANVIIGITDIQGMDFYVAACAPHITSWDSTMRIQGAFDYLRNTRNNHMPLTSWSYSQGFCKDCWKTSLLPGMSNLGMEIGMQN